MKKLYFRSIALFTILGCQSFSTNAQSGSLDFSFDNDGILTTTIGTGNASGNTIVIQPDGKILLGGNSGNNLALARYQINGSLDDTFGMGGAVTTNLGCANASGSTMELQNDGKILLGGYCGIFPNYDFALTRYNTDGSLDQSFGNAGSVITPILNAGDQGLSIAIQNDGKILLGGVTDNGSNGDFALVRYHTMGSLDSSFGTHGKVITAVGPASEIIRAVVVQQDGKIVVAGYSYTAASFSYDFVVARYHTNGSLDNSFGNRGILTTAIIQNTNDYAESMVIQADGKIIVGGYSFKGHLLMARYTTHGVLDPTFGTGGTISTVFGCAYQNDYSIALQSDGKILLGGYSTLNRVNSDFAVARYTSDGKLDHTFGIGGMMHTPIGSGHDIATSIAIQPDGKIVLAGRSQNGNKYDFSIVRYHNTISTGINTTADQTTEINIIPNPFSLYTSLQAEHNFNNAILTVYNSYGLEVKQIKNISGNSMTLHRNELQSGLYILYLTEENKVLAVNKLVIID
ncbi:MAG: T9SS type A sorting domain-containing protein [Saprospiraceae bacterium]|nr:T9SS type A sorting domain-containing protein [Saprospiraceae bacterium]